MTTIEEQTPKGWGRRETWKTRLLESLSPPSPSPSQSHSIMRVTTDDERDQRYENWRGEMRREMKCLIRGIKKTSSMTGFKEVTFCIPGFAHKLRCLHPPIFSFIPFFSILFISVPSPWIVALLCLLLSSLYLTVNHRNMRKTEYLFLKKTD